jgi:CHRD domain-containing protein
VLIIMNNTLIISSIIMLVIELSGVAAASSSDSNKLQQQNQSFTALLTGNNVVPPVSTNATGIVKFLANTSNINELTYVINLTNIQNDVARIDLHLGNTTENGRSLATLYRTTINSSEICCRSAASESERNKFFFNGTISTQNFEFGPLANKNITDLLRLFNRGNAYVEVDTYQPKSLSLSGSDSEIRGQIMPFASNSSIITADVVQVKPIIK